MVLSAAEPGGFKALKELLLELAQERSLEALLPLIVKRLLEEDGVALARLWLAEEGDECATCRHRERCLDRSVCLHLVASAYRPRGEAPLVEVRAESAFRRIPIGAFKVGAVAATQAPIVVTDPTRDPHMRFPAWVAEQGIAGFVGQPLSCRGQMLGVLGVFLRVPVSTVAVDVLRILANHAAAAIATARAFAQVEAMRARLQVENHYLRQAVEEQEPGALVGESEEIASVKREIRLVAATDATVLITGESGTGKELVARSLHRQSPRADKAFVAVNCAAIPRELFESDFFGHVRGAFSGAVRDRAGRFEAAEGGTLFLDEIGEMPLDIQGKLLRVLQEGTFERVGDQRTRRADARIVAATNRDLRAAVEEGRFREDLYYRLAVFPVSVPALRERPSDIPLLAAHFVDDICRRMRRRPLALSEGDLEELAQYQWPGNVRELRNLLERAVISSPDGPLRVVWPEARRRPASVSPVPLRQVTQQRPQVVAVRGAASVGDEAPWLEGMAPAKVALARAQPVADQLGVGAHPPTAHQQSVAPVAPSAHATAVAAYEVVAARPPVLRDEDIRSHERRNILAALERAEGRIYGPGGAAHILGVKPTTLASRLARMGLKPRRRTQDLV